jgi:hypothetical protein
VKVICKRTYIEDCVKFVKGNYYDVKTPNSYEKKLGVYYHIKCEKGTWDYIKYKDFQKYFIDIDQLRTSKINEILNDI